MDYAEKQWLIAYRTCAEEGDEKCVKELRESFEKAQRLVKKMEERQDEEKSTYEKRSYAEALYTLGQHYYYGFGLGKYDEDSDYDDEEDEAQALVWFRKAAEAGDPDAMNQVAWYYGRGQGIEPDENKYYEWEKKAAKEYYERNCLDDALHVMRGLPDDDEIRELHRSIFINVREMLKTLAMRKELHADLLKMIADLKKAIKNAAGGK
jgi:TPR repeat protein